MSTKAERLAAKKAARLAGKKKGKATVKVTATRRGYYGERLREPGDTFRFPADQALATWMVLEENYIPPNAEADDEDEEDESKASSEDVI